jgi:hypothetical protein
MSEAEEYSNKQNKSWILSLRILFDTGHLRGCIGERLVDLYIHDELIPLLKKKEEWTDILYIKAWYHEQRSLPPFDEFRSSEARKELWESMNMRTKVAEEEEARLLIVNGFYPTKGFLEYFRKLTASLSHRADGFLIKMKGTGTFRTANEAIKNYLSVTNDYIKTTMKKDDDFTNKAEVINYFGWKKLQKDKMLPEVNGEIEVIEVKTGSKEGVSGQTSSYRNAAANGFPLRFFHVDLNSFLIKEKLIANPNEITSNCFKDSKNVNIIKVSFHF